MCIQLLGIGDLIVRQLVAFFIYTVIIFYTSGLLVDSALTVPTVLVILIIFTPDCNVEISPSSDGLCHFINRALYGACSVIVSILFWI